jgi:hypothetical protein
MFWWAVNDERWTGHRREHVAERRDLEEARRVVDTRLEGMNELRRQIDRERSSYMTREMADTQHIDLSKRIGVLEEWRSNIVGKLSVIVAANAVIMSVVVFVANYVTK